MGHFGDVLHSQSLGFVLKTESNTTKANKYPHYTNRHLASFTLFPFYYVLV